MSIRIICQHCNKTIKAPDSAVGKIVKCPGCNNAVSLVIDDVPLELEPVKEAKKKDGSGAGCGCLIILAFIGGLIWLFSSATPAKQSKSATGAAQNSQVNKEPVRETKPSFTQEHLTEQLQKFVSTLAKHGIDSSLVSKANISSISQDLLEIHVTNSFVLQPYQIRLQGAQNLWRLWAAIHTPDHQDTSRIRILDMNGNEIGGSRMWGGSLIWVSEK